MGRHSDGTGDAPQVAPAPPAVSATDVALWGPFATVVAAAAARVEGAAWSATALVAGLGAAVSAVLWAAIRRAGAASRQPGGRRRVQ